MRSRSVCTCGAGLGGETADEGTSGSCLAEKLWLELELGWSAQIRGCAGEREGTSCPLLTQSVR